MAKPKFKIKHTITKKEWNKTHKDFKSIIDGIHYVMKLTDKGTALVPVNIDESIDENFAVHMAVARGIQNAKVKNPETKKDVKVTTALKDKNHPAHKQAKSLFQRIKDKVMGEGVISEVEMGDMGYVEKHKSIATVYGVMSGGKKVKVKLGKTGKVVVIDTKDIKILPESVNEAYKGKMSDFKYEFPNHFENETGNPVKAIKKMSKKGKGYEVRTSTYMSEPEMKKVGDSMGLKLVDYQKSSNIAISLYESVVNEAKSITLVTYGGKKTKYSNSDIDGFIRDLDLTAEDLPGLLYRASMKNAKIIGTGAKSYNKKKEAILKILKKIKSHSGDVVIDVDSKNSPFKHDITFESIEEAMVTPKRGHNYYKLTKDTPIKYVSGHSGIGLEVPGVLLHNEYSTIKGKKGAYIIDYFGAHFYVDMKNKFASRIANPQNREQNKDLMKNVERVFSAPDHSDWKKYMNESINEDTKKRFDVDFYQNNRSRTPSYEEMIRGDKFSDVVSQAIKIAKSKGMIYVEFYYKDAFIGSIDKKNGYEFKKGRSYQKSPLSINEGKDPEIITQLRDVVKSGYKTLKDPKSGKRMKVDTYSASAIVGVYDKLNPSNQEKFVKQGLLGMQSLAFKFIK